MKLTLVFAGAIAAATPQLEPGSAAAVHASCANGGRRWTSVGRDRRIAITSPAGRARCPRAAARLASSGPTRGRTHSSSGFARTVSNQRLAGLVPIIAKPSSPNRRKMPW